MNIKEAKAEILHTIKTYLAKDSFGNPLIPQSQRRPIFLSGAPGIGKTAIIRQAAEEADLPFLSYTMTHHTRQSVIGLPQIREEELDGKAYTITGYTMSEILAEVYSVMKNTGRREGILFLDEINCVSETLLPTMLQFLQFKTFGTHPLPEGWIIAAAGNPPAYNRSAREFDIATLDRVRFLEVTADLSDWLSYGRERELHPTVLSYLSLHPDNFCVYGKGLRNHDYATPRAWEDLSSALKAYEALNLPVTEDIYAQFIHSEGICRDFASYFRICKELLPPALLEQLFEGRELPSDQIPDLDRLAPGEKLALLEAIRSRLIQMNRNCSLCLLAQQSLLYFTQALPAGLSSRSELEEACKKQISARLLANEKKKAFGLLTQEEERQETVIVCALEEHLASLTPPEDGIFSREYLRQFILDSYDPKSISRCHEITSLVCRFVRSAFRECPETYLFFLELKEAGINHTE